MILMDGIVDNMAAKQKISFLSKVRVYGQGAIFFFLKNPWAPLVKKRVRQLLLLPRSEMYKYVIARGVFLSVEGVITKFQKWQLAVS